MKISIITSLYPSASQVGHGAFVRKLAVGLSEAGLKISVLYIRNPLKFRKNGEILEDKVVDNYTTLNIPSIGLKNKFSKFFYHFFLRLKFYIFPPLLADVVYFQFLGNAVHITKKIKQSGKFIFIGLGESTINCYLESFTEEEIRKSVKLIDGVISVSKKNKDWLTNLCPEAKGKIIVLPNAVDLNVFRPVDRVTCISKTGLTPAKFTLIFVGHFDDRKGINRTLEATKSLDVELILIGKGNLENIPHNVIFHGEVLNTNLPYYLNLADIFVLPTKAEGNCNSILEAMACGLPILSSDIPEIKEQVNKDCGILVDPTNSNAIKDGIESFMMLSKEELYQYKINALKTASGHSVLNRHKRIIEFVQKKMESASVH